jgi:hypothetical protein
MDAEIAEETQLLSSSLWPASSPGSIMGDNNGYIRTRTCTLDHPRRVMYETHCSGYKQCVRKGRCRKTGGGRPSRRDPGNAKQRDHMTERLRKSLGRSILEEGLSKVIKLFDRSLGRRSSPNYDLGVSPLIRTTSVLSSPQEEHTRSSSEKTTSHIRRLPTTTQFQP